MRLAHPSDASGRAPLLALAPLALITLAAPAAEIPDFSREISPILSDSCFHCHGPDANARKANLRLDLEGAAKDNSDGAAAIIPGDSANSPLFQRVSSTDPDEVMPPEDLHRPLSPAQIDALRRWIDGGAPWGSHWAFSPIARPEVPTPVAGWPVANPIDAFVQHQLAGRGLTPSPEAPAHTLARRLALDLTGLPPSPEALRLLGEGAPPDAYAQLVDQLLASPHFGERWAWPWLDAARYADSNGYQHDRDRTMWPWRDWVVSALNDNLPFDQFTLLQIAGDKLPDASREQIVPTGFFRNHMINGEGGRIPEENRVEYVMDMAETFGTTWLGLTFNCARCHDHKYDPISQAEYYQLFAFFNQTPTTGAEREPDSAPNLPVPDSSQAAEEARLLSAISDIESRLAARESTLADGLEAWAEARAAELAEVPSWSLVIPSGARAEHQELEVTPQGTVLASGPEAATDSYQITLPVPEGEPVSALLIEAIRHPSMNFGALARSDSGNFVLTHVALSAGGQPVPIRSASATFEQAGFPVANALDPDPATGWAVHEGRTVDRDHAAVFVLAEPFTPQPGQPLQLTLDFSSKHHAHILGHLRLSLTNAEDPQLPGQDSALASALTTAPELRTAAQAELVAQAHRDADPAHAELSTELAAHHKQLADLAAAMPVIMVLADRPEHRPTPILEVGLYDQPTGTLVGPGTPSVFPPLPPADGPHPDRLSLARWTIDPANPLTARVAVNRLWQELWGVGLVKTSNDFGLQAEFPLHLDLLDFLAAYYIESGWDTKALLRLIVTSHTYRQSSRLTPELLEQDPENRLLARASRYRLPSWMIRDQALAVSGLLVPTIGGPPVRPYQPEGIWSELTFGKISYQQDAGDALHRRSLYTFWRRIVAPTGLFDVATRQTCSVTPKRTNTPMHALTTLNDITYVEAARHLAARAAAELGPEAATGALLAHAFTLALARPPSPEELAILAEGHSHRTAAFAADPDAATALLTAGDSPPSAAEDPVQLAALAATCLAILNLDETLSRE